MTTQGRLILFVISRNWNLLVDGVVGLFEDETQK